MRSWSRVKIRARWTDNFTCGPASQVSYLGGTRLVGRHEFGEVSVPKLHDIRTTATVEPDRLRLILERLQNDFYREGPPAEHIAVAVLAALKDFDQGPPLRH